jgi:putative ABC transport system ATP-binding protein
LDCHSPILFGGEKQRVGHGRAPADNPRVLLSDEPTGALNQATGQDVLDLMGALLRDGSVLTVVTPDPGIEAL